MHGVTCLCIKSRLLESIVVIKCLYYVIQFYWDFARKELTALGGSFLLVAFVPIYLFSLTIKSPDFTE